MFLSIVVAALAVGEIFSSVVDPRPRRYGAQLDELIKDFARLQALLFGAGSLGGQGSLSLASVNSQDRLVDVGSTNLSFSFTLSRLILPKSDGEGGRLPRKVRT